MKKMYITNSDDGEWIYCCESPEQGEPIRITNDLHSSEPAFPVIDSEKVRWVYVERFKTVRIATRSKIWCHDGEAVSEYSLLKLDESNCSRNWIFEVRTLNYARFIADADNSPWRLCSITPPLYLNECFRLIYEHELASDSIVVSDSEVSTFARSQFCLPQPIDRKKTILRRLFPIKET